MMVPDDVLKVIRSDSEIVSAYLFGSRADGVHRDDSDWDLAVLWLETVASTDRFRRRTRLMESLGHLLGTRVDVVDLMSAPVLLAAQAIDGNLLFDRDPATRSTFEMHIKGREADERIAHRWIRRAMREA
jgi:predicted nucleotidyltransferase